MPRHTLIKIASLLIWSAIAFAVVSLMRGGEEGSSVALFCLGMAFISWLERRDLQKKQRD